MESRGGISAAVESPIRPVDNMGTLRPTLPDKYSPLSQDGRGSQSVYLTAVPPAMAHALAALIGREAQMAMDVGVSLAQDTGLSDRPAQAIAEWEEHLRSKIEKDVAIPETTARAVGAGSTRPGASSATPCRASRRIAEITGVNRPEHLIASHCKPWRDCDNSERLDGENGLTAHPLRSITCSIAASSASRTTASCWSRRWRTRFATEDGGADRAASSMSAGSPRDSGDISNFIESRCFCRPSVARIGALIKPGDVQMAGPRSPLKDKPLRNPGQSLDEEIQSVIDEQAWRRMHVAWSFSGRLH